MIGYIFIFVAGFVVGALVARKNLDEVNKIVEEAKELAAKAEAELKELKVKQKKPVTKRGRKTPVKTKK
tara:strand:+ start:1345 stop:1551 length:207 start_codon:yes stop_codon:yes gene_type:complete